MIKLRILILLLLAQGFVLSAYAQDSTKPATPKILAQRVFDALKNNDFKAFQGLLITEKDCEIIASRAQVSEKERKQSLKQMSAYAKTLRMEAEANLNAIRKECDSLGFDLTNAVFIDFNYELKNRNNVESCLGMIICQSGNKRFGIMLDNVYKSDGWLLISPLKILGAKKE